MAAVDTTTVAWKACTKKADSFQLPESNEGPGGKPPGPSCFCYAWNRWRDCKIGQNRILLYWNILASLFT